MDRQLLSAALVASIAALATAATRVSAAAPEGKESCYGIALKGHNDCAAAPHSCAGQSTASYSRSDFKYVPAGTCLKTVVHGHKGSTTPA